MSPSLTNLPNYFLADLPPEATLTASMLAEACDTLKRNRQHYLVARSTRGLVMVLSDLARSWLAPDYHFRHLALEHGPAATGFSRPTLAAGLDSFFKQLTSENFQALLQQDLGHAERLDQMVLSPSDQAFGRAALATGPELLVHFAPGNVPNPALMSIVLGLLVRSAQFVKCSSRGSFLPRLFAHSLYEIEPKLGACLEIASWRGGNAQLENELFAAADCVTATGTDETLSHIRQRLRPATRFLGYGHKVSFAYLAAESLSGVRARELVRGAAADVAAWNQLGCLSPHVIYVQEGGMVPPETLAALLADALAQREELEPRGELPVETAAAIASRRSLYEIRAAHSPETRHWSSKGSTAWTVVYETDARFQVSCLNRFVYVKPVKDLTDALQNADSVKGKVSTVALAAPSQQARELTLALAHWGATRVCPVGQMQNPPLTWHHDGRPALGELVTWTDWEGNC